ncbi:MAG TPA: glycosyltransferase family 39 protein [bacterium]|nr:glycosyltransferase family 39 protein [bacterium]
MGVKPGRIVFVLIAVSVLARLLLATRGPLIDDEAYYWLWSRRLDWSYLDHPPLIAYLIAITTTVADDPLWLRLGPILTGAATTYMLFLLGRDLFGSRAGVVAAGLFQVIPVLAGGGLLATPDSPLFLAWTLALRSGWHASHGRPRQWIGSGIAVGLGMLSKLYMVFLPAGLILLLITRRREQLRRWELYAAGAIALAIFAPVIYWNVVHNWAGVRFILFERPGGTPTGIRGIIELLVQQLAFVLVLFFALIWAVIVAWRRRREDDYAFLLWASLPALLFPFVAAAATGAPHGNWLGPGYLGLIVVLGAAWNRAVAGMAVANTALIIYGLLVPFLTFLPLLPGAGDLVGWPDAARRVRAELTRAGEGAIVVADRYQIASQLGYYLQDTVPVTILPCPHPASIWPRPGQFPGATAIAAIDARWAPAADWKRFFATIEELSPVIVRDRGRDVRTFRIFHLRDLRPPACASW